MKNPHSFIRKAAAAMLACSLLAGPSQAGIAYGSINNFDTVNDTGHECHGFEIEIEDCHTTDITYTYDYNHYGTSHLSEDNSIPGHPKTKIRWESKKNPDGTWAAHTAIPSGPISPTNGHMFTNPAVNFGGEHFGVGYRVPANVVRYHWLIDDGTGNLVNGGAVQVSTPTFTYYPPVNFGAPVPPQVQAVIAPPPPPVPEPMEFGKAVWVKEIRTTSHNNREVKLRDLVSDDPDDAHDKNWKNGEPDEVEAEWQILQKDYGKADGGAKNQVPAAAEDLPGGDEVVTRRYEFYKYVGPLDTVSGEAMGESVGPDGLHGSGIKIVNGVETDLSTVTVVGDFTGSQMAAVDVDAPVGLIDHVSEGKMNHVYAARTLVVEGALPFQCVRDGALPAGMEFDEFTGILSGTPTVSGEFQFTITATDTFNAEVAKTYTLLIAAVGEALPPENLVDTVAAPLASGTTTGDGSFATGSEVTVVATPEPGYRFVNWTENGTVVATTASHTFPAAINHSLIANFTLDLPQFAIASSASPVAGGNTSGDGLVDEGATTTLVATPNAGYTFANWTDAGLPVSSSASYTFTVTAARTLVANFTAVPSFTVTTGSTPAAGGTTTGGGSYFSGSSATVTATANAGYVFLKWTSGSNSVSTTPSYTFSVTANQTLVANFVVAGTQQSILTSASPLAGGITSGGGNYLTGDSVTVQATAHPGYAFSKWQVGSTTGSTTVSTTPSYNFVVTGSRTLVAKFNQVFEITATSSPGIGGTTEMDSLVYKIGDRARARAFPADGFTFVDWTDNGIFASSDISYSFDVVGNRQLVANFTYDFGPTIATRSAPLAGGSTAGEGVYNLGQDVTVSASPNPGYAFAHWTVGGVVVSTDADYNFTAGENLTLVANFAPAILITATSSPAAGGLITGDGDLASGATATLSAFANPDFLFRNWTESGVAVSESPVYRFTVTAPRTLVAHFSPAYTITAAEWPVGGGSVLGAASISQGSSITLVAVATEGYTFVNWTDANGNEASTSPSYTFTPTAGGAYTANFSAGLAGIHFNFDSGIPLLPLHTAAPFSQTVGGLTAAVSSPGALPPTIETEASSGFVLSKFAAHFLAPSATAGTVIEIQFDQPVAGVSFNFATVEDPGVAVGSNVFLSATDHTSGLPVVVGTALAHGATTPGDSFPSGTLTFNSGINFDSIRIELAAFPVGAQKLLIDNLIVSPAGSTGGSMLLANPNWNITLTDFGYSDYLLDNTPGFEGREYLSGEWGSAISYVKDGAAVAPTWLEPQFLYPDWKTNSDFQVVQGIHLVGANLDGLPIAESIIANNDLELTLRFEMIDTVTGTPMGTTRAATAGAGSSINSNRYVLNQSFKVRNLSGVAISDVRLFQLMHGLTSEHGVYDNRAYAGKLSQYRYDATLAGIDATSAGANSSTEGLEDSIAFHSKTAPTAFEIGHFGIEGNGLDDHSNGKPSDGVHLSIEQDWQGAPYALRQGRDEFAPADRWIAGGQRWSIGDLAMGQTATFDIVLSLLTGTKVTHGGGGNPDRGSCNGGSSHVGGVDFEFDGVTSGGTFFGDYAEADDDEMVEREDDGQFALPTFPRPQGSSSTQLWNLQYSGSHQGRIHLTFAYDPALLPAGFNESALAIYHFNGTLWELLPSTVNTVTHKIAATTASLSPFALGTVVRPIANSQGASLSAGGNASLALSGTTSSGNPLVFQIATPPAHGQLSAFNASTGTATYTPVYGFAGTDAFTFQVNDGVASSTPVTVTLDVTQLADTDADGMPDAWEQLQFNHPTNGDPALDSDGDGASNLDEYLANTDPNQPASRFQTTQLTRTPDGHLTLTWSSVGGVRYRVQSSDTLIGAFTDLVRPIADELDPAAPGTPSTRSFTDDFTLTGGAPAGGARFYRVKVAP